jgi:hypothetical protein
MPGEVDELHPELLHAATIISTGESVVLMENGSVGIMVAANSCSLIVLGSENMTTADSTGRSNKEVNVKL